MVKYLFLVVVLFGFSLVGCSKDALSSGGSSEETTGSCKSTGNSHSGCCSSHGGIGGQCSGGKICYTPSGRLVCNDGTISPSCTQSISEPQELEFMNIESEKDIHIAGVSCS